MKRFLAILLVVAFLGLCGCNGYKEIDRGYLVTALGIEQTITGVNVYIEAASSSDVDNSEPKRVILRAGGITLQNAFKNLRNTVVKPLYFEQLGTVVLNQNPSDKTVSFLQDAINLNLGVYLIKSYDVEALFKYEPPNGFLGYDIIGLIKSTEKEHKISSSVRFYQFYRNYDKLCEIAIKNNALTLNAGGITFD